MENETLNRPLSGGFALRKIPVSIKENTPDILTDNDIDKIKIIELSTAIDRWEQEVLFGDKGFYSLKGKEVEGKTKEFIAELKSFINSEINGIIFKQPSSREIVQKIKNDKIEAVKTQLELYTNEQLNEWEIETYENALTVTSQRAVLYKDNPSIIELAFKNGLKVLDVIAQKENWNDKLFNYRKKQFISDFYLAIIQSFIQEKDVRSYQYFNKYKNQIKTEDKEKLENQVDLMRINVIANNWAKEVFSYNLDEKDFEKELKNIKDEDIKSAAKQFYSDLKKSDKRNKLKQEKEQNIKNWKEVIDFVQKDIDKAALYIDYSFKKESIQSKKEYIKQMREFGVVKTDIKKFLSAFSEIFTDFQSFREKDISDLRGYLSLDDYDIFETIQKYTNNEFIQMNFDYKNFLNLMNEIQNKSEEDKYDLIRMYFAAISDYKAKKKENPDIESRKKLIEALFIEKKGKGSNK